MNDENEWDISVMNRIWNEKPAIMIDWIRNNRKSILDYMKELSKNLDEFIKELN